MQPYRSAFILVVALLVAWPAPAEGKRKARGWLGVALKEVKERPAGSLDAATGTWVVVQKVFAGSAAKAAGVKASDIVLELDGRPVASMRGMIRYVGKQPVGHTLRFVVHRGGADVSLTATLGKRPDRKQQLADRWVDKPLPDGLELMDVATGKTLTLAELRGKPFIIDYWATTCGPCKVANPIIGRLRARHAAAGVRVLAVSYEPREKVAKYAASHTGYDRDVMVDPEGYFGDKVGLFSLPTFMYLDAAGVVRSMAFGLFGLHRFEHDVEVAEAARRD